MVESSETERKERMDTSSLMEQILSKDNLNQAVGMLIAPTLQAVRQHPQATHNFSSIKAFFMILITPPLR